MIGLWLLGRRDLDDFYSQKEIPTLQALAYQTVIALTNMPMPSDYLRFTRPLSIKVKPSGLAWDANCTIT